MKLSGDSLVNAFASNLLEPSEEVTRGELS